MKKVEKLKSKKNCFKTCLFCMIKYNIYTLFLFIDYYLLLL